MKSQKDKDRQVRYPDGTLTRVGDRLVQKRFLREDRYGTIEYIFDPSKLCIPNGDNDFGYQFAWDEGSYTYDGSIVVYEEFEKVPENIEQSRRLMNEKKSTYKNSRKSASSLGRMDDDLHHPSTEKTDLAS